MAGKDLSCNCPEQVWKSNEWAHGQRGDSTDMGSQIAVTPTGKLNYSALS